MALDIRELETLHTEQIETNEADNDVASGEHGEIMAILTGLITNYVYSNSLGRVFGSQTTFKLDSGLKREPDVSFVKAGRLLTRVRTEVPLAPDLAVEVVSKTDTAFDIEFKVLEYLEGGVQLVWVVYPVSQKIAVYHPDTGLIQQDHAGDEELSGEDVLPGFRFRVKDLFEN